MGGGNHPAQKTMDIVNVECQLAQAQMARYLAGDALPEDTIVQLEKHVKECPQCQQAAQDKKISLTEMLGDSAANAHEESVKSAEQLASELRAEMGLPATEIEFDAPKEMIQLREEKPAEPDPVTTPPDPEPELVADSQVESDQEPVTTPAPAIAQERSALETDPELAAAISEIDADPAAMLASERPPEPIESPVPHVADAPASSSVESDAEPRPKIGLPKFTFEPAAVKVYFIKNAKPLGMGFALGIVLMAMGAFTRKPTTALGPRASEDVAVHTADPHAKTSLPEDGDKTAKAHAPASHKSDAKPEPTHEGETQPAKVSASSYRATPSESEGKPKQQKSHSNPDAVKPSHGDSPESKHESPPPSPPVQHYAVATNSGVHKTEVQNGRAVTKPIQKPTPTKAVSRPKSATVRRESARPRRRAHVSHRRHTKKPAPKSGTGFVKVYR